MLPVLMTNGNQTKSRFYHIHELCLLYKQDASCLLLSTTENQAQVVILKSTFFLCSKWWGIMKATMPTSALGLLCGSWECQHPAKWQSFHVALRATKNQYFNCIKYSMTQLCWVCNTVCLKHPQSVVNFGAGSFLSFFHSFPESQLSPHQNEMSWLVCPVTPAVSVGGIAEELWRNCRVDFPCWTCRSFREEVLKLPSRNNTQRIKC